MNRSRNLGDNSLIALPMPGSLSDRAWRTRSAMSASSSRWFRQPGVGFELETIGPSTSAAIFFSTAGHPVLLCSSIRMIRSISMIGRW